MSLEELVLLQLICYAEISFMASNLREHPVKLILDSREFI